MTRFIVVGMLGCWCLLTGCADTSDGGAAMKQRVNVLEAYVLDLQDTNTDLKEESRLSQEVLQEYTEIINQTLSDLEAITKRENMLREIRLGLESNEVDERTGFTIRERINENLAAIDAHIRSSKRRNVAFDQALKDTLAALNFEGDIAGLERTIRQLNIMIEQKEETIKALRAEAQNMQIRIVDLSEENTVLVEENTELREAYYVIDTQDGLEKQGIIDQRGGFLSIGKQTQIDRLDAEKFDKIDIDVAEIYVGADLKGYQVLSDHKTSKQWYSFGKRNNEVHLTIHNPEAFWKISRYLIIEVNR